MARGRGRPTEYKAEYAEQAYKLCLLGATDKEIADFFGVNEKTLNNWKQKHPDFLQSLKEGKEEADAKVAKSLYHRALGYSHEAVKIMQYEGEVIQVPYIEHYPPDTTACIFWLKNRQPKLWRDKVEQEITGPDGGPIGVVVLPAADLGEVPRGEGSE
ncbi:conserved hypothetical protein [Thermosinus carboxydivorans Nor1]|uniref:Terminase n=1 Tax=Thermosinus carboxydivorans Nor1 TaxID=401526 RepID=A1HR48_9FIRM|nr:hypothetical protein [Thermosinus carboxydivorans]EAX47547.1 conserved hypothetical protein [Thermosinus carboxydivorans Nor1]